MMNGWPARWVSTSHSLCASARWLSFMCATSTFFITHSGAPVRRGTMSYEKITQCDPGIGVACGKPASARTLTMYAVPKDPRPRTRSGV